MILELVKAFALIFVAEMGDKTQILAMAFATKFKIKHVVIGIFIGSLFNHALAVLLGANLQYFVPLETLSIIAGFSFVFFGLWSLKMDTSEDDKTKVKYGPIITVSLAFFIGELGDKTQLAAIALSTDAQYPLFILIGTVSGMVITGILGIIVGIKLGHKIDEFYIKIGTAIIFIVFGYIKLFSSLSSEILTVWNITLVSGTILLIAYMLIVPTLKLRQLGNRTRYQQTALRLHDYYNDMYKNINKICLGENHCGKCGENSCLVGYTKNVLLNAQSNKTFDIDFIQHNALKKDFDRVKVLESLVMTLQFLKSDWESASMNKVHIVRMNLEYIMYQRTVEASTFEEYIKLMNDIDQKLVEIIR